MSGDICYLCFEKSDQMKQNFQQSIQNMNIQEFAEHFCQFIFQDSSSTLEEICMKCWQTLHQFGQYCEKIRGIHQNLVEETGAVFINKLDEHTEILEDEEGENAVEEYEYQKSVPILAIDADLVEEADHYNRRPTEMTPKIIASLEEQLKFEAITVDLADIDFDRFARFIPMECVNCKCPFDTFDECHDHYLYLHNRSAVWNCCNLALETPHEALDHMKYHESIDVFKCAACYKCFLTSNKLKYHIRRTHLPIESGTFDCTVCDKKCKNLRLLLNHQKSHIQIVCIHCKKQISASNYEQHVRTIHTVGVVTKKRKTVGKNDAAANKKKKIDEKNAPSSSSTPKQSQKSSMSHKVSPIQGFAVNTEPNENGMFECDICSMQFKQVSLVYSHRNKVHV